MTLSCYATAVMSVYAWMREIRSWHADKVREVLKVNGPHLPPEYRAALFAEARYRMFSPSSRGGGNGWRE